MKLNKSSQLLLAASASLLAAGLLSACATLTVDFVYVTSAQGTGSYSYGNVDVFEINSESGRMRQIPASPFPSGGRLPVAETVSADMTNLYVANQDDNTIVQFVIGNDGKLYPVTTVNTPGIFPLAVTFSNNNLFVLDLYQPLPSCSPSSPCSGDIAVLPIVTTKGTPPSEAPSTTPVSNGTLTYWPLCLYGYTSSADPTVCQSGALASDIIVPTGVNVLTTSSSQSYAYVTAYDSTASPTVGYIFAFSVASSGALTPLNNGVPFTAGTHLSAVASDSTGSYLYATDYGTGDVFGYSVAPATGQLTAVSGGGVLSGGAPAGIVVDPKYPYAYVANSQDSTVTAFSISGGVLTRIGTYATGLQPVAIGIDPSTSHFVYTANFLGSNVSGFSLNPADGTLLNSQFTPYAASALPNAVAAVPHGVQ